jgi:hypothetical protein
LQRHGGTRHEEQIQIATPDGSFRWWCCSHSTNTDYDASSDSTYNFACDIDIGICWSRVVLKSKDIDGATAAYAAVLVALVGTGDGSTG